MHPVPVQMGAAGVVLQDKGCGSLSCAMMDTVIVIFADAENQSLFHISMTSGIALGYHEVCDGTVMGTVMVLQYITVALRYLVL